MFTEETRLDFQQSSTRRTRSPSGFLESFKLLYDSILLLDCSLKREDAKQNKALAWNKMNNYSGRDSFSLEISFHTFSHSSKESSTCPLRHSAKIIRRKSRNLLPDLVPMLHLLSPPQSMELLDKRIIQMESWRTQQSFTEWGNMDDWHTNYY